MPLLHLALVLSIIGVWGFNFVIVKVGLEGIPPIFLCFARFFFASIPAVFFIKRPAVPFKMIVLYGMIMFVLQFSVLFLGIYVGVSAALASILLQLQAFFSIVMAVAFLGEKIQRWQIIGGLVSFMGIALVAMNLGVDISLTGLLLVITAAVFWGMGSIISKKMGHINMLSLVIWASLISWPPLLLISFFAEGADQIFYAVSHLSWQRLGSVFYLAYLATIFGFGIWNWLIRHHPVSKIAPFTLLIPFVGTVSSALVLGESLPLWKIFAGLLIVGGLCINLLGPRLAAKRSVAVE